MFDEKKVIIFNHIPKTGGTTINHVLEKIFSPEDVLSIVEPENFSQDLNRAICGLTQAPYIDIICSHLGHDLSKYLPENYNYVYFTFIREPVARVVSHYNHVQRKFKNKYSCIEDFIHNDPWRSYNVQTSFLSGAFLEHNMEDIKLTFGCLDRSHLERAKKVLAEEHLMVGVLEDFNRSLLLMGKIFSWHIPTFIKQNLVGNNAGFKTTNIESLSENSLRLIEDYNQLDRELYNFGKTIFQNQIAIYNVSDIELQSFMTKNFAWSSVARIRNFIMRQYRKIISA